MDVVGHVHQHSGQSVGEQPVDRVTELLQGRDHRWATIVELAVAVIVDRRSRRLGACRACFRCITFGRAPVVDEAVVVVVVGVATAAHGRLRAGGEGVCEISDRGHDVDHVAETVADEGDIIVEGVDEPAHLAGNATQHGDDLVEAGQRFRLRICNSSGATLAAVVGNTVAVVVEPVATRTERDEVEGVDPRRVDGERVDELGHGGECSIGLCSRHEVAGAERDTAELCADGERSRGPDVETRGCAHIRVRAGDRRHDVGQGGTVTGGGEVDRRRRRPCPGHVAHVETSIDGGLEDADAGAARQPAHRQVEGGGSLIGREGVDGDALVKGLEGRAVRVGRVDVRIAVVVDAVNT